MCRLELPSSHLIHSRLSIRESIHSADAFLSSNIPSTSSSTLLCFQPALYPVSQQLLPLHGLLIIFFF